MTGTGCTKGIALVSVFVLAAALSPLPAFADEAPFSFAQEEAGEPVPDERSATVLRPQDPERQELTLEEIAVLLSSEGYGEIRRASRSGDAWRIVAVRNNGAVHELTISAFDGVIFSRRKAGWTRVPLPGFGEP